MTQCKHGKLASPVSERGSIRRCKLAKKTKAGRKQDYRERSSEFHEKRYRRDKKAGRR